LGKRREMEVRKRTFVKEEEELWIEKE